jgi:hypothetical protein
MKAVELASPQKDGWRKIAIELVTDRLRVVTPVFVNPSASSKRPKHDFHLLFQLRVLCLGFFQDGDVGVGVFPEREEIFVGGERPTAGKIGIRALRGFRLLQGVGTSHAQMRQRSRPAVPDDAAVVDDRMRWTRSGIGRCWNCSCRAACASKRRAN